jgi:hypothetical protein
MHQQRFAGRAGRGVRMDDARGQFVDRQGQFGIEQGARAQRFAGRHVDGLPVEAAIDSRKARVCRLAGERCRTVVIVAQAAGDLDEMRIELLCDAPLEVPRKQRIEPEPCRDEGRGHCPGSEQKQAKAQRVERHHVAS